MAYLTALFDACVLYSESLRSLTIHLTDQKLFRARWTRQIHDEWTEAVLQKNPMIKGRITKTVQLMNDYVPDSLITGFERLIPSIVLPDPDDRHVLAAAIVGRVDVIVTFNLPDFPPTVLEGFAIDVQHPDDFYSGLAISRPDAFCKAFRDQRLEMKKPPFSLEDRFRFFEGLGLNKMVRILRGFPPEHL